MDSELREEFLANKAKNEDYVGKIVFDSGLIDLPFVQAKSVYNNDGEFYTLYDIGGHQITEDEKDYGCDGVCTGNDVYIWTDWETGQYDKMNKGGSVFLDYRNEIDDQNLIIYGHHFSEPFDPERNRAFTPLEKLMEQENYEENKFFSLILDNEIREYQIAYVYEYSLLKEDEPEYYRTAYDYTIDGESDPGYYDKYIEKVKEQSYYDTGLSLTTADKTVTLQTCYSNRPDYRLIIVAKELGRVTYN